VNLSGSAATVSPQSLPLGGMPSINYQTTVKIVAQDELYKAFEDILTSFISYRERMVSEFDVMKGNLQNLMKAVLATKDDLVNLQPGAPSSVPESIAPIPTEIAAPETAAPSTGNAGIDSILSSLSSIEENMKAEKAATPPAPALPPSIDMPPTPASPPSLSPPPGLSLPPGADVSTPPGQAGVLSPQTAEGLPILTPMPMKPGQVQEDYSSVQAPVDYSSMDNSWSNEPATVQNEVPIPAVEQPPVADSSISNTKEEVETELTGLQNKLNSIRDLRTFVAKKYDSGKLTKSNYEKQMKKFDRDVNKTKFRIDELKDEISKF
jgi:hypothetical protein